jgi:hypothetical protein
MPGPFGDYVPEARSRHIGFGFWHFDFKLWMRCYGRPSGLPCCGRGC